MENLFILLSSQWLTTGIGLFLFFLSLLVNHFTSTLLMLIFGMIKCLAACFLHYFSIISKTFYNKFACRRFDSKLTGSPTNRITFAGSQTDQLYSFFVANYTIFIIFILSACLPLPRILLNSKLALVILYFKVNFGCHSFQITNYNFNFCYI